jgi:hypothetical protein
MIYSPAEIEGLLAKVTPEPWWFDGYCYIFAKQPDGNCYPMIADYDTDEAYLLRMRGVGAGLVENGQQKANAEFIAAAPTIVRQLLARVKELETAGRAEIHELSTVLTETEAERDTARTELVAAHQQITEQEGDLASCHSTYATVRDALATVTEQRNSLLATLGTRTARELEMIAEVEWATRQEVIRIVQNEFRFVHGDAALLEHIVDKLERAQKGEGE